MSFNDIPPEPLVKLQNNFTELFFIMPFIKIAQMVPLHWSKGLQELKIRNISNDISWTTGPNSKYFHRIVPHDAFYQNCTNGSALPLPNKRAAGALNKKCLLITSPPEPLVQIQNNFTQLFLMQNCTNSFARLYTEVARALDEKCL